nr:leucine-rich repeat protein [Eubacterium sp.]
CTVIKVKNKRSIVIPNTVRYDGDTYKVTNIKKKAFKSLSKLKKVTIKAKSLKKLKGCIFYKCKKLKTIKILKSLRKKVTKKNMSKCKAKIKV